MLKALNVPLSVQRNARKGLELRKLYGRGGTPIGEASAKKLSSGKISLKFAKHVANYFPRHAGDNLEQTEKSDKGPSNGYIAWLLWGGDEARNWLEKRVKGKQMKTKRKQNSPFLTMPDRATAEAFAEAARKAGHTNVFVSGHKGRVGVLLGAMSGLKANELLDKLRAMNRTKQNPKESISWSVRYTPVAKGDWVTPKRVGSKEAAYKLAQETANKTGLTFAVWGNAEKEKDAVLFKPQKANPSLPSNASAQQIYAKMKQLSSLKSTLENKGTRKDFLKAERIGQQMKALAKKHQQALGLKANPLPASALTYYFYETVQGGKHRLVAAFKAMSEAAAWKAFGKKFPSLPKHDYKHYWVSNSKMNPSMRGLKAIGGKLSRKVSSIAKRVTSKAKASLKRLTPSGRRSLAAIKRLQEASLSDPLGKTKRMILETRKSKKKAKNPRTIWWDKIGGSGPEMWRLIDNDNRVYGNVVPHRTIAGQYTDTVNGFQNSGGTQYAVAMSAEDQPAIDRYKKDNGINFSLWSVRRKNNPWSKGERVEGPEIHYSGPSARHAGAHNYGAYQAGREWRKSANYYSSGSPLYFGRWWDAHPKADGMTKAEAKKFWTLGVKSASPYSKKRSNPKRKPSRKRNSASASAELYEKFHGKPSTSILEIEEEWHIHKNLAQLGTLVEIKVLLNPTESKSNQRRATLAVPHSDNPLKGVQLCSSENARKTLYLVGGDQSLPLKALGFTAADEKDLMYIGEIEEITYRTRKHFDQFKKIDYYHGLGEVSKVRPQLLYRSRDKKLLIAGGQYDVRPEGIVN